MSQLPLNLPKEQMETRWKSILDPIIASNGLSISSSNNSILTSSYTVKDGDFLLVGNTSKGALTVYLPQATGSQRLIKFKYSDSNISNAMTISTAKGSLIQDALASLSSTTLNTQGEELDIVDYSVGVWQVTNRRIPSNYTSFVPTITGSTSNPTKGTTTTDTANWCRTGRDAVVYWEYVQTNNSGAANGSGDYQFNLPTGMLVDTSIKPAGNTFGIGSVGFGEIALGSNVAQLFFHVSTSSKIIAVYDGGVFASSGFSWGAANTGFAGPDPQKISISLRFPVSGWNG